MFYSNRCRAKCGSATLCMEMLTIRQECFRKSILFDYNPCICYSLKQALSYSSNLLYPFYDTELFHQLLKAACIINVNDNGSCKKPIMAVNIDRTHQYTLFL